MTTFGFSAFLKLISLNIRPQRTELTKRFRKDGNAYDFHRAMRLEARRMLVEGKPKDEVFAAINQIKQSAERASGRSAIDFLASWHDRHPAAIFTYDPVIYESPTGVFKVKFETDFAMKIGQFDTAIHIWNTKKPKLESRLVGAALSLFPELYASRNAPNDLAVLSVRDRRIFRLSEIRTDPKHGTALADYIERLIIDTMDRPEGDGIGPQPSTPLT